MIWRRPFTVTSLILLMAVSLSLPVAGTDYTILLDGDHFRVTWRINAVQNITSFSHTIVFPQSLNSSLAGADLAAFASSLQNALQTRVATVGVSQAMISLVSNNANRTCSFNCPLQKLSATIAFQVQDTSARHGGVAQYDMQWKAIRLDDNLRAGTVAFNTLGQTYLVQALASFFPIPKPGTTFMVRVGGQLVGRTNYQDLTGKIVLLDMSVLSTPLQDWIHTQDIDARTETWTSPRDGGFNITAIQQITELDVTFSLHYFAAARVSAELSTPLNAFARGDILFVDFSNSFWEQVALVIIIVALGVLVASVLLERRITRRLRQPRRTGKGR